MAKAGKSGMSITELEHLHWVARPDITDVDEHKKSRLMRMRVIAAVLGQPYKLHGQELRLIRDELGMTQDQLGILVHRGRQAVLRWETGQIEIDSTAETVIRLLAIERFNPELSQSGNSLMMPVEEVAYWSGQKRPDDQFLSVVWLFGNQPMVSSAESPYLRDPKAKKPWEWLPSQSENSTPGEDH